MEIVEDIVIVGAGIAGLTTALGLHRNGLRSLVLESWNGLRVTGFAFTTWMNAWKCLDVLGVGDSLRNQHDLLKGVVALSTVSGSTTTQLSFKAKGKHGDHEVRCVRRQALLDALARDLPQGTIRFRSKVVLIEEANLFKLVHLADGTILKTKVLIGCDGVNSVVARWLGLQSPLFTGRSAIRGITKYPDGHNFDKQFFQFFGDGYRSGFLPCDEKTLYWFFAYTPSSQDREIDEDPTKMKNFVVSKLGKVDKQVMDIIEKADLDSIISSLIRFRWPTNLLWGPICKGNVCVAGDALHPMTPDIGQGGCSSLEDGIVLARCLSQAFLAAPGKLKESTAEEEQLGINKALDKFAQERKWRSFQLISTAYVLGRIQQSGGMMMNFLRDKVLSSSMAGLLLKSADYDCGNLNIS